MITIFSITHALFIAATFTKSFTLYIFLETVLLGAIF